MKPAPSRWPLSLALAAACVARPATERLSDPLATSWPVVHRETFAAPGSLDALVCSDPRSWRHHPGEHGQPGDLELVGGSTYRPPFRSPLAIALLKDLVVGDFDLDVDLLQTGRDYGHRDLCIVFAFESPQRFCYLHLAPAPDAHAHNLFLVCDAPRVALAPVPAHGIDWGHGEWHHVHLERRLADGSMRVFWDHATEPLLVATDRTLGFGRVGLGSFDDRGRMRDLEIRAPAARRPDGPANPFAPAP